MYKDNANVADVNKNLEFRVLVVSKSPEDRVMIAEVMRSVDSTVKPVFAADLHEGISAARESMYDKVFFRFDPERSGRFGDSEVEDRLTRVGELAAMGYIKPVMIVGSESEYLRARFRNAGCTLMSQPTSSIEMSASNFEEIVRSLKKDIDPLTYLPKKDAFMELFNLKYEAAMQKHIAKNESREESIANSSDSFRIRNMYVDLPFALFYFDLVGFKAINDAYGHLVADAVIREFGRSISHRYKPLVRSDESDRHLDSDGLSSGCLLRPDSFAGRVGGDEFAVFVDNLPESEIDGFCNRLFVPLTSKNYAPLVRGVESFKPVDELYIAASVGVAKARAPTNQTLFNGYRWSNTSETLYADADRMQADAKTDFGNSRTKLISRDDRKYSIRRVISQK